MPGSGYGEGVPLYIGNLLHDDLNELTTFFIEDRLVPLALKG